MDIVQHFRHFLQSFAEFILTLDFYEITILMLLILFVLLNLAILLHVLNK